MPDDYQSLFAELSGTSAPAAEPVTQSVEEPVAAPVTEQVTEPATAETTEPSATPKVESKPIENNQKEDASAKAFAAMRTQNSKYQKVFTKLQEALGADNEDDVIEKLLGVSYETLGKKQNTDPAVLKRLSELEEVNNNLMNQRRQEFVVNAFNKVKSEFNLNEQELMGFAETLASNNIDIFSSNIDLTALYRGMNHEAITKKLLETEKQKWIKEQAAADKAPSINPATGKRDPNPKKEINSMSDLDLALKSLS